MNSEDTKARNETSDDEPRQLKTLPRIEGLSREESREWRRWDDEPVGEFDYEGILRTSGYVEQVAANAVDMAIQDAPYPQLDDLPFRPYPLLHEQTTMFWSDLDPDARNVLSSALATVQMHRGSVSIPITAFRGTTGYL